MPAENYDFFDYQGKAHRALSFSLGGDCLLHAHGKFYISYFISGDMSILLW